MIGLLFAVAPFALACLVARREPAHRPVRDALGAAFSYSFWTLLDDPADRSPRALLILWSLVAVYSGWAYLRAFAWDASEALNMLGAILVLYAGAFFWPKELIWWRIATWGPFVSSSAAGLLALYRWALPDPKVKWWRVGRRWFSSEAPGTIGIVQRVALILLASDVCMLLFIPWPGVQVWQGRSAAVAVFAVQVEWLYGNRTR